MNMLRSLLLPPKMLGVLDLEKLSLCTAVVPKVVPALLSLMVPPPARREGLIWDEPRIPRMPDVVNGVVVPVIVAAVVVTPGMMPAPVTEVVVLGRDPLLDWRLYPVKLPDLTPENVPVAVIPALLAIFLLIGLGVTEVVPTMPLLIPPTKPVVVPVLTPLAVLNPLLTPVVVTPVVVAPRPGGLTPEINPNPCVFNIEVVIPPVFRPEVIPCVLTPEVIPVTPVIPCVLTPELIPVIPCVVTPEVIPVLPVVVLTPNPGGLTPEINPNPVVFNVEVVTPVFPTKPCLLACATPGLTPVRYPPPT